MEQITLPARRKSRWGVGIVALYAGFALFSITLAVVAALQDVSLVETDYYERGLAHQGRIDAKTRAAALSIGVAAAYDPVAEELAITFPPECASDPIESDVVLYRPSNARWDRHFAAESTNDGVRTLEVRHPVPGIWKLHVEWQWRGESYYSEAQVYIPS